MSNGQNTANLLAALSAALELATSPAVTSLVSAAKAAVTEGRDITDDELQAAVDGEEQVAAALKAAIDAAPNVSSAQTTVETSASAHGSRPV